jgi:hypothetical protein
MQSFFPGLARKAYGDKLHAQVSQFGNQSIQSSLIVYFTSQDGFAVIDMDESETIQPLDPTLIKVTLETDFHVLHGDSP